MINQSTMPEFVRLCCRRLLALYVVLTGLTACASDNTQLADVRGQPVPTAAFVFFDKDAAQPQAESEQPLREAAAFLVQYDNTIARIVGHVARDEAMDVAIEQRIDTQRATAVGTRLIELGVAPARIEPFSAGRSENMSQSAETLDMDRRVDILFGVQ